MKVCHFSKKFSSQNKLILNIQSSIELSHIQGILSNYSEVFLFFAKYGFLFENVSLETESSKSKHAPVESTLSTQDPARDGNNWYGYCGQNPVMFQDQSGLIYYTGPTGSSVQSSIDYVGVTGSTGGECHGSGVSIMPDIPDNLSVEEQMQILEDITNREYENEQQKANAARYLRTIMRNTKKFNLDGLFNLDGNEIFMNETLRDFLNTSDSGDQYNLNIIKKEINNPSSGWYWEPADSEHQDGVPNKDNKKYVNKKDGREVVFDKYGNVVNDKVNKGTYNFGTIHSGIAHCVDWTSFSEHGRWDMDPYFRQFGKNPIYRSVFGHWYYSFEYGNQENLLRNYYEHH